MVVVVVVVRWTKDAASRFIQRRYAKSAKTPHRKSTGNKETK